jgi:protein Tex
MDTFSDLIPSHHLDTLSRGMNLAPRQVLATAALLKQGSTVPFIARYRKEMTNGLDEVAITGIRPESVTAWNGSPSSITVGMRS